MIVLNIAFHKTRVTEHNVGLPTLARHLLGHHTCNKLVYIGASLQNLGHPCSNPKWLIRTPPENICIWEIHKKSWIHDHVHCFEMTLYFCVVWFAIRNCKSGAELKGVLNTTCITTPYQSGSYGILQLPSAACRAAFPHCRPCLLHTVPCCVVSSQSQCSASRLEVDDPGLAVFAPWFEKEK